jgi:hypothetical protein
MWATTKYESCRWKSSGGDASITPVIPPSRNVSRNPIANSIGVSKVIRPPHIVPIQLKNLTPVGTAMRNESPLKKGSSTAPVANMWCAHTPIDSPAIASVARTMPL